MSWRNTLRSLFKSNYFYIFIIVSFILSSLFVATITKFDVPHDERYHFTLVKRFVHEVDPFINEFVSGDEFFGDIQRNPSIMYHYLLSKPLYVVENISQNEVHQILFLRLVNIIIAVISLVVVRKLALKVSSSKAIANLVMGMTAYSTIFIFISSAISYDNLFVLLFLLSFYFSVDLIENKNKPRSFFILLAICLFGSLVKQSFLIFGFLYAVFFIFLYFKTGVRLIKHPKNGFFLYSVILLGKFTKTNKILVVCTLILVGMFMERYGINVIRYGTPLPDCSQVHTLDVCNEWPAYARNTNLKQTLESRSISMNFLGYADYWLDEIRGRTNGVYTGWDVKHDTLLIRLFMLFSPIVTFYLLIVNNKKYKKLKWIILAIFITVGFSAFLLLHNYTSYINYRHPVAIQARYLMPVLPIIYLTIIFVISKSIKTKSGQSLFYTIVAVCFLTSGIISYIQLTSGPWYRSDKRVDSLVRTSKRLVRPLNVLIVKD